MTRQELHDKFLALRNRFTNMYQNSDLDITDTYYDKIYNWLNNIVYVLGFEPNLNESRLKAFENTYQEAEIKVYARHQ